MGAVWNKDKETRKSSMGVSASQLEKRKAETGTPHNGGQRDFYPRTPEKGKKIREKELGSKNAGGRPTVTRYHIKNNQTPTFGPNQGAFRKMWQAEGRKDRSVFLGLLLGKAPVKTKGYTQPTPKGKRKFPRALRSRHIKRKEPQKRFNPLTKRARKKPRRKKKWGAATKKRKKTLSPVRGGCGGRTGGKKNTSKRQKKNQQGYRRQKRGQATHELRKKIKGGQRGQKTRRKGARIKELPKNMGEGAAGNSEEDKNLTENNQKKTEDGIEGKKKTITERKEGLRKKLSRGTRT